MNKKTELSSWVKVKSDKVLFTITDSHQFVPWENQGIAPIQFDNQNAISMQTLQMFEY